MRRAAAVLPVALLATAPVQRICASATPALAQDAGALATWKDGEIREAFDASTRISQIFVAVMPSGPHGSLTLVFSARWPGRTRTTPLTEFEVRADVGLRVNPNFIRQPTLLFTLDPGTPGARVIDLTERLQLPPSGAGSAIDTGRAMMTLVELIQLMRARTAGAEVFALPMTFTPEQLEALRRFGDRVVAPAK
jgi:hypothetical protein